MGLQQQRRHGLFVLKAELDVPNYLASVQGV